MAYAPAGTPGLLSTSYHSTTASRSPPVSTIVSVIPVSPWLQTYSPSQVPVREISAPVVGSDVVVVPSGPSGSLVLVVALPPLPPPSSAFSSPPPAPSTHPPMPSRPPPTAPRPAGRRHGRFPPPPPGAPGPPGPPGPVGGGLPPP